MKHLERLGNWDRELSLTSGKKVDCKFLFKSHPGKDYGYLLCNPQEFEIIRLINWSNSIEFACVLLNLSFLDLDGAYMSSFVLA